MSYPFHVNRSMFKWSDAKEFVPSDQPLKANTWELHPTYQPPTNAREIQEFVTEDPSF